MSRLEVDCAGKQADELLTRPSRMLAVSDGCHLGHQPVAPSQMALSRPRLAEGGEHHIGNE